MSKARVGRWQNWSGSVRSAPREVAKPSGLEELVKLVEAYARTGRRVRVVGAGHSFTPLVSSDDVLMSLERMQGIESIEREKNTVTVWGGTTLHTLGNDLLAHGLAQENLGDIDVQSIAGAISTGTHGTGMRFGTLSTQVAGLTLVTGSGEVLECSQEKHAEIFKAAQTSFGALGIIAKVTLRTVPARLLRYQGHRERLSSVLAQLERYRQENAHFEFFWFPHTDWVQAKFLNVPVSQEDCQLTESPLLPARRRSSLAAAMSMCNAVVLENWVYQVISEMCRLMPSWCATASTISAAAIARVDEIDYSHRLFATPRMVRFQEMEYNLPAHCLPEALERVRQVISAQKINVHFPLECRFVHSDDIWLSPAYGRDSAYIAVHMYRGMPYTAYFHHVEAICQDYQGRPHWGKMHTLDHRAFSQLYPRWGDFLRLRQQLDPQGMFLNAYLCALLGLPAGEPVAEGRS
jgi:FAD-linked oxidoreductase